MHLEHSLVVGEAARRQRCARHRERLALAYFGRISVGGISAEQLAQTIEVSERTARRMIANFLARGLVERLKGRADWRYAIIRREEKSAA